MQRKLNNIKHPTDALDGIFTCHAVMDGRVLKKHLQVLPRSSSLFGVVLSDAFMGESSPPFG